MVQIEVVLSPHLAQLAGTAKCTLDMSEAEPTLNTVFANLFRMFGDRFEQAVVDRAKGKIAQHIAVFVDGSLIDTSSQLDMTLSGKHHIVIHLLGAFAGGSS